MEAETVAVVATEEAVEASCKSWQLEHGLEDCAASEWNLRTFCGLHCFIKHYNISCLRMARFWISQAEVYHDRNIELLRMIDHCFFSRRRLDIWQL